MCFGQEHFANITINVQPQYLKLRFTHPPRTVTTDLPQTIQQTKSRFPVILRSITVYDQAKGF